MNHKGLRGDLYAIVADLVRAVTAECGRGPGGLSRAGGLLGDPEHGAGARLLNEGNYAQRDALETRAKRERERPTRGGARRDRADAHELA